MTIYVALGGGPSSDARQSVLTDGTIDQDYDRITLPFTLGLTFTIEMWLYALSSNTDSGPNWYDGNMFFDQDMLSGNDSLVLTIHAGVPQISIEANGNATNGIQNASTDIRGGWSHLVLVRNGSTGAVQFYVDGTREINATMPAGDLSYVTPGTPADQYIELGGEKHTQGTPAFEGYFSEIRISDNERYSGASIAVPSSPLQVDGNTTHLYPFSEGSGADLVDLAAGDTGSVVFGGAPQVPAWDTQTPY